MRAFGRLGIPLPGKGSAATGDALTIDIQVTSLLP